MKYYSNLYPRILNYLFIKLYISVNLKKLINKFYFIIIFYVNEKYLFLFQNFSLL